METELYFFDTAKEINIRTRTNDIPMISNEEAVIESIKNILDTKPGERIWNPEYGVDFERFLFEPLDGWIAQRMIEQVETAILRDEPRAIDVAVEVEIDFDNLLYDIFITAGITTSEREIELNFQLEQVR